MIYFLRFLDDNEEFNDLFIKNSIYDFSCDIQQPTWHFDLFEILFPASIFSFESFFESLKLTSHNKSLFKQHHNLCIMEFLDIHSNDWRPE